MAKPKPPTETDLLFEDSIRRALAIPPEEAKAICERTAPAKRASERPTVLRTPKKSKRPR